MNAGLANFCCCFIDCSELTYLEENHQEKMHIWTVYLSDISILDWTK